MEDKISTVSRTVRDLFRGNIDKDHFRTLLGTVTPPIVDYAHETGVVHDAIVAVINHTISETALITKLMAWTSGGLH